MRTVGLLAVALAALALVACGHGTGSFSRTVDLPYARCAFTITAGGDDAAVSACTKRISEVFRELDMYRDDADLAAVNRAAGRAAVTVSADAFAAIGQALDLARATGGRYDPTVGPLTLLWGISGAHPRGPAARRSPRRSGSLTGERSPRTPGPAPLASPIPAWPLTSARS